LTKVHRHKQTRELFYEYANRCYDSSKRPLEADKVANKFQPELIGTESEDRLDKKICPWDAIRMYEFDEGAELSKCFYQPANKKVVNGLHVVDAGGKTGIEERQN
jgi:hypothetical protein